MIIVDNTDVTFEQSLRNMNPPITSNNNAMDAKSKIFQSNSFCSWLLSKIFKVTLGFQNSILEKKLKKKTWNGFISCKYCPISLMGKNVFINVSYGFSLVRRWQLLVWFLFLEHYFPAIDITQNQNLSFHQTRKTWNSILTVKNLTDKNA